MSDQTKVFVGLENGQQVIRVLGPRGGLRRLLPYDNEAPDVLAYLAKHLPAPTSEEVERLEAFRFRPVGPKTEQST